MRSIHPHLAHQLNAVSIRQTQVHQRDLVCTVAERSESLTRGSDSIYAVTVLRQYPVEKRANDQFVINDENAWRVVQLLPPQATLDQGLPASVLSREPGE